MKRLISFKLALVAILATTTISCNSNKFNYNIKEYILTIEPRANSTDVDVTLDLTYMIDGSNEKSDGFKYVGNGVADSLYCSDENGIIRGKVEYLKETKVSWFFNPVKSSTKKIKAKFILRDYLTSKGNSLYELYIPWAGVFRVDVELAKYVIIMHKPNASITFTEPENWKHEFSNGLDYYSNIQVPLKDKTVKIQLEN
jgi:hypothetical protein